MNSENLKKMTEIAHSDFLQRCLYCTYIEGGFIFLFDEGGLICHQYHPRMMNTKTLTELGEDEHIKLNNQTN